MTRSMFEGKDGSSAVPKPEKCDSENVLCNYPFNPNKAGEKWLNLVKKEWNSTQVLEKSDFNKSLKLYQGKYQISGITHFYFVPPISEYFSEIISPSHIKLTNNSPNMDFKSV